MKASSFTSFLSSSDDRSEECGGVICETLLAKEATTEKEHFAHVHDGFGHCSQCNCPQFQGEGDLCGNCGHNFGDHFNS